jgi:hypothetical protein
MYSNAGVWLRRCRAQRATDVEYPLQHRETGEHSHSVDGWGQKLKIAQASALREQQSDGEDHDAHGARCKADLALHAERLGARPGVADHQRQQHGEDDRCNGRVVALAREEDRNGG